MIEAAVRDALGARWVWFKMGDGIPRLVEIKVLYFFTSTESMDLDRR